MGAGGSVISKCTKELWSIVDKSASHPFSPARAQQLMIEGGDIKRPNKNGQYMIQIVVEQEKRNRLAGMIEQANVCQQLVETLKAHASTLFVDALNNEDIGEMKILVQHFGADCYQGGQLFGPLGLIGHAVQKRNLTMETIKFLVESDIQNKFAITGRDAQGQTVFTSAKCQQSIVDYLKEVFNSELNRLPFQPTVKPQIAVQWIQQGANPEWTDDKGNTVLCNAILVNNLDLVKHLVAAQCNTQHENSLKQKPLSIARNAAQNNPPLIAFLENAGINRQLQTLIRERRANLTQIEVQDLLKQGADIRILGPNNDSLLHLLIANDGTPELMSIFVNSFSADIEMMNLNGHRPIEICIVRDNLEQLQAFFKLAKVVTEHFFNKKLNKSLLTFAKEQSKSSTSIVTAVQNELNLRLWKCSSMANKQEKKNPLIMAEAKRLCELGAQINHLHGETDDGGGEYNQWSVLHLACKISNLQWVRFLIETLNANKDGAQPISIAAEYGQLDIVQFLQCSGSKVNVIFNKDTQDTPLHLAAKNNNFLTVRYLVLWGADHEAKNAANKTPLDLARTKKSKMTKEEEVQNKQMMKFLEQLNCPDVEKDEQRRPMSPKTIDPDIDVCNIPLPILIDQIKPHDVRDEDPNGEVSLGMLVGTPNGNLRTAAKDGNFDLAKASIAKGADIRHREGNNKQSCYDVAILSFQDHTKRTNIGSREERDRHAGFARSCQYVVSFLQNIAQKKLIEAIKQGRSDRVVSYHLVGAELTSDLLSLACRSADNIETVAYLINNSPANFIAMSAYPQDQESPFSMALKSKHFKIVGYLNWCLSDQLTNAVNTNDFPSVRRLAHAGASVDSKDKQNLLTAVRHNNSEMVVFLCDMGARISDACVEQSKTTPQITSFLNQRLIQRKLRLSAAQGDFDTVVKCQRQGVDINAKNCHGSTALSMAIQHGNYFRIVYTLVSHGASILHSNPKLLTLLQLSKNQNYKQISEYLFNQLSVQFLTAIINNDLKSAKQLAPMGVDFNHQDEQNRTPLHYAVQYHGLEFVKWLCESGANWKVADINGQYPITEATEKGDLPVVKYFIENQPATKDLKNKAGQNALAIAKTRRYNRIVQLLDPGNKDFPVRDDEEEYQAIAPPKYTLQELLDASEHGQVPIIEEFVDQRYLSLATKTDQCRQMIEAAVREDQLEVLARLRPHYTSLTTEINPQNYLTVSAQQKAILEGFLGYLGGLIAGSDVKLDPSDPQTYGQLLYKNLHSSSEERVGQLNSVQNDRDVAEIHEKDMNEVQQKLDRLQDEMKQMEQSRITMMKAIETGEQKLKQAKTAIEKRDLSKEIQETKEQMTVLASEVLLFKAARETAEKKKEILALIKNDPNLVHFYNTLEHRLQSLFTAVFAAQSGLLKPELGSKTGKIQTFVDWIPDSVLPFPEPIGYLLKQAVTNIVSIVDKTKQNKEYRNISTLGNIEYLQKAATNSAGLLTLYYKEQLDSIDMRKKVEGSHQLATFFTWANDKLDGKPSENAIVLVAEYSVAWIIDSLKEGESKVKDTKEKIKNFVPNLPLADQLWLCVAKQDPMFEKKTPTLGFEMGKHKVPLKNGKFIPLKRLFGCPMVVAGGAVYQHSLPLEEATEHDPTQYGYVYLDPFTDKITGQLIIEKRKLIEAADQSGKLLPDILENVGLFREGGESTSPVYDAIDMKQTAISLAHSMREQNLLIDPDQMKHAMQKVRSNIVDEVAMEVNVLRDDFNSKAAQFQTSIDAAYEKITKDFEKCQENLTEVQKVEYLTATRKLLDQIKQSQHQQEAVFKKRTLEMEQFLNEKCEQQNIIVQKAEQRSIAAIDTSTKAKELSMTSEQSAKQSAVHSQRLVESTEQRKQEMQKVIDECMDRLEKTVAAQKLAYEKSLNEIQTNHRLEMKQMKENVENSMLKASESAKAASKSAADAKKTQTDANDQIEIMKEERKKLLKEVKDARNASEEAANRALNAEKHAKDSEEASQKLQVKFEKTAKKYKLEMTE